jgi:hypothetical protein
VSHNASQRYRYLESHISKYRPKIYRGWMADRSKEKDSVISFHLWSVAPDLKKDLLVELATCSGRVPFLAFNLT